MLPSFYSPTHNQLILPIFSQTAFARSTYVITASLETAPAEMTYALTGCAQTAPADEPSTTFALTTYLVTASAVTAANQIAVTTCAMIVYPLREHNIHRSIAQDAAMP
jgi:hypothetical protein